jgi:transposase InsO family protein
MMARLAAGERLSELCREFGISRKTGSKFKARFDRLGAEGLEDLSRAPHVIPHRTPPEMMDLVVAERRQHPTWGARKLKDVLQRRSGRSFPSASAINTALAKAGLLVRRKRSSRPLLTGRSVFSEVSAPNDVWAIDYKGQFRLGDRTYCYPLTITDQFSRYLLACEGMAAISDEAAREACSEVFTQWGVPLSIRSDNGAPFASTGLGGLTKLSAFFIRLGIQLERIRPSHPEENGRHERMHRTLKAETTRPARANLLQQQEVFDDWMEEFNHARPHEALDMKRPAELFVASPRPMPASLPELQYPLHDDVLRVSRGGIIYIAGLGKAFLTTALAGQEVGIREESDNRWLVTFGHLDLGIVDRSKRIIPIETARAQDSEKASPMCLV